MPALSTNVRLRAFDGALTVSVNVHAAAASKPRNAQVCVGTAGAEHLPIRVTTTMRCASCGDIHSADTKKARPVGDGYIVLTEEDIAAATGDLVPFKKTMDLVAHPAAQVDALTAPGKSMNYLQPAPGFEVTYAMLAQAITARPDVVYVTRWVPRTALGVFSLHVLPTPDGRNVIVMRERVAGEQLKEAPDFTLPQVPEAFGTMSEEYLTRAGIAPFDMADYRDTSEEKLAEVVAGRAGVPIASTSVPSGAPALTAEGALAALQARVDSLKPKRAPRKAAAPRTTARKAAAPKTSTAKAAAAKTPVKRAPRKTAVKATATAEAQV